MCSPDWFFPFGCHANQISFPSLFCFYPFCPLAEKKWFTDEPDNAYPRNIQIKPMSTHMANQINQYKSTSSLIPPIREVEDECWLPREWTFQEKKIHHRPSQLHKWWRDIYASHMPNRQWKSCKGQPLWQNKVDICLSALIMASMYFGNSVIYKWT